MTQDPSQLPGPGLDTVEIARVERLLRERTPEELAASVHRSRASGCRGGTAARRQARRPVRGQGSLLQAVPARNGSWGDWTGRLQRPARRLRRALCGTEPGGPMRSGPPLPCRHPRVAHPHGDQRLGDRLGRRAEDRGAVVWEGSCITCCPFRRNVVLGNLRRVFGEVLSERDIRRLAQAYCAHFTRFLLEFVRLPLMSPERRKAWVRVENMEAPIRAARSRKGALAAHRPFWKLGGRYRGRHGSVPAISPPVSFRAPSPQARSG